jgi:ribosomal protein S13
MQAVEVIIDPFPVAALQDRYGIGQAQVYNRMEKLGIKPETRGKLSAEQVRQLDEYDKYLKEPKPEISNLTMGCTNNVVNRSQTTSIAYSSLSD